MKTQVATAVAVLALLGGAAFAQKNTANRLVGTDSSFITKAAQGGMAEVELGKLATERASNSAVKDFGQRMVTDHTKANEQLKTVAANKGVNLPEGLDAKDQATLNRLSKLNGAAFDRAYIDDMVKDHKADVAEFQKEADRGDDADIKAFASKTLPTLQDHLRMAEDTQKQVK